MADLQRALWKDSFTRLSVRENLASRIISPTVYQYESIPSIGSLLYLGPTRCLWAMAGKIEVRCQMTSRSLRSIRKKGNKKVFSFLLSL